jgi:hypothetical protein
LLAEGTKRAARAAVASAVPVCVVRLADVPTNHWPPVQGHEHPDLPQTGFCCSLGPKRIEICCKKKDRNLLQIVKSGATSSTKYKTIRTDVSYAVLEEHLS